MSTTAITQPENKEANTFLRELPRLTRAHVVNIGDAPAPPATPARHPDANAGNGTGQQPPAPPAPSAWLRAEYLAKKGAWK
jgi:hypothetical protein